MAKLARLYLQCLPADATLSERRTGIITSGGAGVFPTVFCVEIFESDTGGLILTFLFLSLAVPAVFGGRTNSCVAPLFLVARFAGF